MVFQVLLLLLGVCAGAASIIMIKACGFHPVLLASYRQLAAVLFLLPFFVRDLRRERARKETPLQHLGFFRGLIKPALLPGITLSLHFIAWIVGARMTLSANATLVVNMAPIVMPLFAFLFFKEVITGFEIGGTILALGGTLLLAVTDFHLSRETFAGDMLCFISMILFALYLALGRRNRGSGSLWLYLVPVYAVSGVCSFVISLFFTAPWADFNLYNLLMTLLLSLISTVVGHSILNHSVKIFRMQTVSLVNMSQFIFGGLFGFMFFGELPNTAFYLASLCITAGTVLVILFGNRPSRSAGV